MVYDYICHCDNVFNRGSDDKWLHWRILILLGSFKYNPWVAAISVTGVVLGAAYMLWMVKKVFFGPKGEIVTHAEHDKKHVLPRFKFT